MNRPATVTAVATAALLLSLGAAPAHTNEAGHAIFAPSGAPRVVDFNVREGTEMSPDISSDDAWIVFHLLGNIYRLPVSGGKATCLTCDSGIALNFHPRLSPSGKEIAFISDRNGQNNVWVMNVDGTNPRAVSVDLELRWSEPHWSADGQSVFAVRAERSPGEGWQRPSTSIWEIAIETHAAKPLLTGERRGRFEQYFAPAASPDGRFLYFHAARLPFRAMALLAANFRVGRLDLATHRVSYIHPQAYNPVSTTEVHNSAKAIYSDDSQSYRLFRSPYPAEFRPIVSPDGRSLAFGRQLVGKDIEYRGHAYNRRTVLVVRDLDSGAEKVVLDPIDKDYADEDVVFSDMHLPAFGWSHDGRYIYVSAGGKIVRVDLTTGSKLEIPFEAHVHRLLSEQLHARYDLGDDNRVRLKWIQWPVMSPDRQQVAFVAAGRLWLWRAGSGDCIPLADSVLPSFALTPSWSPDGRFLTFASWSDIQGGAVWMRDMNNGTLRKLTTEPREYIYPVWSPDAAHLVVTKGPAREPASRLGTAAWNGWNAAGSWELLDFDVATLRATSISHITAMQRATYSQNGDIRYQEEASPRKSSELRHVYPFDEWYSLHFNVKRLPRGRGPAVSEFEFPAASDRVKHDPVVSPDGRYIAYSDMRKLFVQRVADLPSAGSKYVVDTDPGKDTLGREQADEFGGVYFSWLDAHTLQFASGRQFVRYDADSKTRTSVEINVTQPRNSGVGSVVLHDLNIITVDRSSTVVRGDVVVEGARIACVGQCMHDESATVLDMHGKFAIPGLIDVHDHLLTDNPVIAQHRSSSALPLAYGITTYNDPSVNSESLFAISDLVETGALVGPRSLGSAEKIFPRVDGEDFTEIRGPQDADWNVRLRVNWGADRLKDYRLTARWQQQLIINSCRVLGCNMTGEGGSLMLELGFAIDGQNGWEHDLSPTPAYADVTEFFGRAHISYSPTGLIDGGEQQGSWEYFQARTGNFVDNEKYRRFESKSALVEADERRIPPEPKSHYKFPVLAQGLADILHAGGYGAIGEHGEQPGLGSHWDMWGYREALTAQEVIRIATMGGARFLGIDEDTGSVESGKLADLAILNSDPLQDIHATIDIAYVMKSGVLYEASTLDAIWPTRRTFGRAPWLESH